MMSTKNEKSAVLATLFFQIAHYALRPWPWIIVGLCALVVYPELTQQNAGNGFVMAMRDFMPIGLRGLIFTAFLGAYMSTISTQLNWGASYLTNDLYKRQLEENKKEVDQRKMVKVGRIFTVMIMVIALVITSFIETIDGAARFLIASSAGLGAVLILRWYWSRINIWSEISATLAPVLGYSLAKFLIAPLFERTCNAGNPFIDNEGVLLFTTVFTTIIWIIVTFLTPKEEEATLKKFYLQVKPQGAWNSIREKLGMTKEKSQIPMLFFCWISAVILTYSTLFFIGKLIFQEYFVAIVYFIVTIIFGILLRYLFIHSKIFND